MPWQDRDGRTLAATFAVHAVLVGTWAGRVPAIKHGLGLSDTHLGVALFGMAVGTLAGSWAGGDLSRALGAAITVRMGVPAMAAALVGAALAGDLAALTAALFLFGTIGAIVDVGMNSIAVGVERERRRPLMSGFHGAWSVGLLIGALLASVAAAAQARPSVQFALVGGVLVAASGPVLARLPRGEGRVRRVPGRPPWTLGLVVLGLIAFCSFFAEGAAADWSAVYLHDRGGAGAAFAAAAFAGFSLAMALSRLAGDRLVTAVGPVALTRRASIVAASGLTLALAVPVPAAGIAGFALLGAGLAPIVPTVLSAVGGAAVAVEAAMSRALLIAYTGSIAGPAAIGLAAGHVGLRAALLIPLALIGCICAGAGRLRSAAG
jgi:hypothetical protein